MQHPHSDQPNFATEHTNSFRERQSKQFNGGQFTKAQTTYAVFSKAYNEKFVYLCNNGTEAHYKDRFDFK
jgi:hypothetical protein